MSDDSINPVDAFAAFSPDEVRRLERYSARTRKLVDCPFVSQLQPSISLTATAGDAVTSIVAGAPDGELGNALMMLRPLYLQSEQAGFSQVQAMVKRHAHEKGTDAGKRAIAAVKSYAEALDGALNRQGFIHLREQRVDISGAVLHTEDVPPVRVFEDFLYGVHFHEDEERIARIGTWLHSELQRFIFISTVQQVAHIYAAFASIPDAILREPSLRG